MKITDGGYGRKVVTDGVAALRNKDWKVIVATIFLSGCVSFPPKPPTVITYEGCPSGAVPQRPMPLTPVVWRINDDGMAELEPDSAARLNRQLADYLSRLDALYQYIDTCERQDGQ